MRPCSFQAGPRKIHSAFRLLVIGGGACAFVKRNPVNLPNTLLFADSARLPVAPSAAAKQGAKMDHALNSYVDCCLGLL